jgi:hypothetical protein
VTTSSDFTDTTKCPLCGGANQCAVAAGNDAESCWCMSVTISPNVLKAIPPAAQGRICICAGCTGAEDPASALEGEP